MVKDTKTFVEKIFSEKINDDCRAGDVVIAPVDLAMAHDSTGPLAIKLWKKEGFKDTFSSKQIIFIIDHYVPCPNNKVADYHTLMRDFAKDGHCTLYDSGEGICHQLLAEKGYVKPGDFVVGADSHTCTLGALGAFATGIGSTDLAVVMATGKLWFKVPHSIEVILSGNFKPGVYAKDLILDLIEKIGTYGATYQVLEFKGEALNSLTIEERMTICNMTVELGAKTGIIEADSVTRNWLLSHSISTPYNIIKSDYGADYLKTLNIALVEIEPMVALPHSLERIVPVKNVPNLSIQLGFLGTCTNGRLDDLYLVANILSIYGLSPKVRLIVAPASRLILMKAIQMGIIERLVKIGAVIMPPGCAACIGTNGVPEAGDNVVSTANRNFKGRMGNDKANVYLVSPATLAASCVTGYLSDPRRFLSN